MRWVVGGVVTLLTGVVAFALWSAFRDPVFIGKLGTYAITTVIPIIVGIILKPASPEELKKVNKRYSEGDVSAPTPQHPHPGEGRN